MAPGDKALGIVQSWPGERTGETVYRTDDGRTWRQDIFYGVSDTTPTGVQSARLSGNFMLPIKENEMPWTKADAKRHTRKAATPKAQRQWAEVSNSVLQRTGDEGRAVRAANAAVARRGAKRGR